MILGLTERAFVRRAQLALASTPFVLLLTAASACWVYARWLAPALDSGDLTAMRKIQFAQAALVGVPFGVYVVGLLLADAGRQRFAPRCPACRVEINASHAQEVARTHICNCCGANLDDPASEAPTAFGFSRAELSRRVRHVVEGSGQRKFSVVRSLGIFSCLCTFYFIGVLIYAPFSEPGTPLLRSIPWACGLGSVGFVAMLVLALWEQRQRSRELHLACPQCAAPLLFVMPQVAATGQCPKCRRQLLLG